uniref:Uncharacterized protein n=1 Tax=Acrobeloides nanus TaxID=290746 RepID=A0A914DNK9_9BILA
TSLPARDRGQQDDSHNDWTYETGSAQLELRRGRELSYNRRPAPDKHGNEVDLDLIEQACSDRAPRRRGAVQQHALVTAASAASRKAPAMSCIVW